MGTLPIAALLCLLLVAMALAMVWMTVISMRDRKDSAEVIPLEVAVCIHKNNGDLIIRQRRGKGIIGLVLGLLLTIGGPFMLVASLVQGLKMDLDEWCMGPSLLILGLAVTWLSLRGFREPNLIFSAARQEIDFRYSGPRGRHTWSFDDLAAVTCQLRTRETSMLRLTEIGTPPQVMIGLQHTDGQTIRICTASGKAAERVPELIAALTGKPVSNL